MAVPDKQKTVYNPVTPAGPDIQFLKSIHIAGDRKHLDTLGQWFKTIFGKQDVVFYHIVIEGQVFIADLLKIKKSDPLASAPFVNPCMYKKVGTQVITSSTNNPDEDLSPEVSLLTLVTDFIRNLAELLSAMIHSMCDQILIRLNNTATYGFFHSPPPNCNEEEMQELNP